MAGKIDRSECIAAFKAYIDRCWNLDQKPTLKEFAKQAGIHPRTLTRWVNGGNTDAKDALFHCWHVERALTVESVPFGCDDKDVLRKAEMKVNAIDARFKRYGLSDTQIYEGIYMP